MIHALRELVLLLLELKEDCVALPDQGQPPREEDVLELALLVPGQAFDQERLLARLQRKEAQNLVTDLLLPAQLPPNQVGEEMPLLLCVEVDEPVKQLLHFSLALLGNRAAKLVAGLCARLDFGFEPVEPLSLLVLDLVGGVLGVVAAVRVHDGVAHLEAALEALLQLLEELE